MCCGECELQMCQIWEFRPKLLNIDDISPRIRMHNSPHQHCLFFSPLSAPQILVGTFLSLLLDNIIWLNFPVFHMASLLYNFTYLFLAALGLHCGAGFSPVAVSGDHSLIAVHGLLLWSMGSRLCELLRLCHMGSVGAVPWL